MIDRRLIEKRLQSYEGARWAIREKTVAFHMLAGDGTGIDCRRRGSRADFVVEILHPRSEGGFGGATVHVDSAWNEALILSSLDEAWDAAQALSIPPRSFVDADTVYPELDLLDPAWKTDPAAAMEEMEAFLRSSVDELSALRLGYFELRGSLEREHLQTDAGLSVEQEGSLLHLYAIVLAGEGDGARDWRVEIHRRRFAEVTEALVEALAEAAREVGDVAKAGLPKSRQDATVLITGAHLQNLFLPLTWHASAEAASRGLSRFEVGTPLLPTWEEQGPSLRSDALLPGGLLSRRFDGDGVPGQNVSFVEKGRLKTWLCPLDRAEELGLSPTGRPSNLVVECEGESMEALLQSEGPLLWVTAFAEFRPSPVTGSVSGEIRFAYEIEGGKRRPVTGGAVSLSVFDALQTMRVSEKRRRDGSYDGPAAVRLNACVITGE